MRSRDGPSLSASSGHGKLSSYSTMSTSISGTTPFVSGVPGLYSSTVSPPLFRSPPNGPNTCVPADMPKRVLNSAGSIDVIMRCSPDSREVLVGKMNSIAPSNSHPLVKTMPRPLVATTERGTVLPDMLRISTNSFPVAAGLYMISLMTTGPTLGYEFVASEVCEFMATKSTCPSLLVCRPNVKSRSAAPNDCDATFVPFVSER